MEPVNNTVLKSTTSQHYRQCNWRRIVYLCLVFCTSIAGTLTMSEIIIANGVTPVSIGILLLFSIIFAQVATFFWTAIIGFTIQLFSRNPVQFASPLDYSNEGPLYSQTAVVMPVFNEDPVRVIDGFESTVRSLLSAGKTQKFHFHVLSDTTSEDIAQQEQTLFNDLKLRLGDHGNLIHYRRRLTNTDRKVGNIAEFCRQYSDKYETMIVLDADSIMSGAALLKLAYLMQNNPSTGIIQMVTLPINQDTLFARMMQFSGRMCSEMFCTGRSFWQLGEGNYFGHNAIIRIKPFIKNCQLPKLSGSGPLSGAILSHDFVEAAWMRRAGYEVWNLADGEGSYEELPSNILDYARRDRRWCQGNLQHLRLLFTKGIHPISRMHFLMGALSFVASPLWLIMLSLGLAQIISQTINRVIILAPDNSLDAYLLPTWPVFKTTEAMILFLITAIMLLLPRLLALVLTLSQQQRRLRFGGSIAVCSGVLLEIIFAVLVAPVLMIFHTCYVMLTACGWGVGWNTQNRGNRALSVVESSRDLFIHVLVGIALLAMTFLFVPTHLIWLSPVLAGLLFSIPLTVTSSYDFNGKWQQRWKLLATPEELFSPDEIKLTNNKPILGS